MSKALTRAITAKDDPVLTCMADVEPQEIDWLWPGRIPSGCITMLIGRPKEGKSFVTIDMAAKISTGSPWPDGSGNAPLGSVIFITAEDDPARIIRPRLDAHGADANKVHVLSGVRRIGQEHEDMFTLVDVTVLEDVLKQYPDCKLVVVDPIGSFLGGKTDAHRDNAVRGVLAPVAKLAEKYGVAVLVVAHRRKSSGNMADDLALGSRAFTGLARANWHLFHDPDNKNRRLLLPGGGNYFDASINGLAFSIEGEPPAICWDREPVAMSADEALALENRSQEDSKHGPKPKVAKQAVAWLTAELGDSMEYKAKDLREAAEEAGLNWRSVQRASEAMGVTITRAGFGNGSVWRLPPPSIHDTIRDKTLKSGELVTNGANGDFPRKMDDFTVPDLHSRQVNDLVTNEADDSQKHTMTEIDNHDGGRGHPASVYRLLVGADANTNNKIPEETVFVSSALRKPPETHSVVPPIHAQDDIEKSLRGSGGADTNSEIPEKTAFVLASAPAYT